jgi:hypothetical protein
MKTKFFDPVKLRTAGYDEEELEESLQAQIRLIATRYAQAELDAFWEPAHPCHPQFDPEVRFIGPTEVTREKVQEHVYKIMTCCT